MTAEAALSAQLAGQVGDFRLDVDFQMPASGVTALFGPSGCGKTTVLRCIAGLYRIANGRFAFAGEVWQDAAQFRPAHKRPIGYVFQEASLFTHLTVRGNLDYGLSRALASGREEKMQFDEVAGLLRQQAAIQRATPAMRSGTEPEVRRTASISRSIRFGPSSRLTVNK